MGSDTNVDRAIYDLLLAQCPAMWLGFPIGNGRVYFVDGINGNNANVGTRPDLPWRTITYALTQCTNDRNDYIIVLDCWQQEPAWPITVNVTRVHIIGLPGSANGYNGGYPAMLPTDDNPVFLVDNAGRYSEIAGFNLGGGVTNGCIHIGQAIGVWVHDIIMGSDTTGAAQDGIRFIAGNAENARIENCQFLGSGINTKGVLTRDGIFLAGGGGLRALNAIIRNNIFQGLPGIAINLVLAEGISITGNKITCLANAANGTGITLGVTSEGNLVDDNRAMYLGGPLGPAFNPFRDIGVPTSHWGINWVGIAPTYPVLV